MPQPRSTPALVLALALAATVTEDSTAEPSLLEDHASLAATMASSPFGMQMHVESRERGDHREGEVIGVLDAPFAEVRAMTASSTAWCAIATLHPNVKACVEVLDENSCALDVYVGRRGFQRPSEAHHTRMSFRAATAGDRGLDVRLEARSGPYGTRDYRLTLEAAPLDERRTVVRLRYGYVAGFQARLASSLYFATVGHDKVGFTEVTTAEGPRPVRGTRGAIERNAVRYFLALRAHLESRSADERRSRWLAMRDRFARQLDTLDPARYLDAKRRELGDARNLPGHGGRGCATGARQADAAGSETAAGSS